MPQNAGQVSKKLWMRQSTSTEQGVTSIVPILCVCVCVCVMPYIYNNTQCANSRRIEGRCEGNGHKQEKPVNEA